MSKHLAKIVPNIDGVRDVACLSRGTRVVVGDAELTGVTRIVLVADVDDIWRATIECHVEPPDELLASSVIRAKPKERWYSRVLRWINGEPKDVTSLSSWAREFEH